MAAFKRADHLLVVQEKGARNVLPTGLPKAAAEHLKKTLGAKAGNRSLPAGDIIATFATIAPDATPFESLEAARGWVKTARSHKAARLALDVSTLDAALAAQVIEAVTAAILAVEFEMPKLSNSKSTFKPVIRSLATFGSKKVDLKRTLAAAEGTNIARWLTALPPNVLTPGQYHKYVKELAKTYGWKLDFLGHAELKKKKAGAFLAVVQGSPVKDAGIAHLSYTPKSTAHKSSPLALVGKGICYDTGGTNLKNASGMYGMHGDMQGSAVALGNLIALTKLGVKYPIDCWLALAENHIGSKAYKQNDVVTASDGTTIEVVHTDAEGRMVLADTLAIASTHRRKPGLIMDYATLTGACVYSLGSSYSGAFTNRPDAIPALMEAGESSGERVWPFPQSRDYDKQLKSDIADIKQCLIPGEADHILAGRFLNHFVKNDTAWVHIDLSAGEHKGGLGHVPSAQTGFGVRFTVEFLRKH
ncbi:MAG: leucyl aminopeptidase family protein [Gammaproteobacteria bacterium]|nr:leucyl aminopeptidase family protein [Gammaproteobacteria bacterium]